MNKSLNLEPLHLETTEFPLDLSVHEIPNPNTSPVTVKAKDLYGSNTTLHTVISESVSTTEDDKTIKEKSKIIKCGIYIAGKAIILVNPREQVENEMVTL